jgi:uncharacterized protein YndB with AHSA1/START domain
MDKQPNLQPPNAGRIVSECYVLPLAVCGLFLIAITAAQGDNPLPAITVTGKTTPTPAPRGDAVSRDWAERSPEINWPTPMFNKSAEIFAHNQIEINASCETVWDHLVHAELWPRWCAYSGKVTIHGGSDVLQKHTKFTWISADVPQQLGLGLSLAQAQWVDALVVECDPPNRLGFRSFGRAWTERGPLISSYHNWYIKPLGLKKCLVTFEEVATGRAARFARMAYPEVAHVSHDEWLNGLKWIAEHEQKRIADKR